MPFIDIIQRMTMVHALLEGIEVCLQIKFGDEGLKLMPELREIHDHELLRAALHAIQDAASPDNLRRVWTRKRRSRRKGQA